MSGMIREFRKGTETIGTWFGVPKSTTSSWIDKEKFAGQAKKGQAPDLTVPTTDTAYNLQMEQDQLRNKQRGVLANIYAGNNAPAPTVATKTLLGG